MKSSKQPGEKKKKIKNRPHGKAARSRATDGHTLGSAKLGGAVAACASRHWTPASTRRRLAVFVRCPRSVRLIVPWHVRIGVDPISDAEIVSMAAPTPRNSA